MATSRSFTEGGFRDWAMNSAREDFARLRRNRARESWSAITSDRNPALPSNKRGQIEPWLERGGGGVPLLQESVYGGSEQNRGSIYALMSRAILKKLMINDRIADSVYPTGAAPPDAYSGAVASMNGD